MNSPVRLVTLVVFACTIASCADPSRPLAQEYEPSEPRPYQEPPLNLDYESQSSGPGPVTGASEAPMDGYEARAYSAQLDARLGSQGVYCEKPEQGTAASLVQRMMAAEAEINRIRREEGITDPAYNKTQVAGHHYVCAQRGLTYLRCIEYGEASVFQCEQMLNPGQ